MRAITFDDDDVNTKGTHRLWSVDRPIPPGMRLVAGFNLSREYDHGDTRRYRKPYNQRRVNLWHPEEDDHA